MSNNSKVRLWQHDNLWRVQDHRHLPNRNGVLQDVWESRCGEKGILFFETEALARAYMESDETKKVVEK